MDDFIYLDNAATTYPKPHEVLEFACNFYAQKGVNPGRTGFDLAVEAEETLFEARKVLCRFFGGTNPNRLVFAHNVTDALNTLIGSALKPGDHAITTRLEHNSVLRPMYQMMERGVEVDFVPFDEHGYVDPAEIERRIRPDTKLVVMNHGSNVIGTVQPVAEIGRICREHGVLFAVDAAQTAGMFEIDVEAMNIDVVCFTGHKSLMAPPGTGGMYIGEHVDLEPCRSGGTGVRSALKTQPKDYPWRFEFGTLNALGIAGLLAGQRWIEKRGGVTKIYEHEMAMVRRLKEGVEAIDGVTLYCADLDRDHLPVFAFNVDGMVASQVGELLDVDYQVICRTGLHCAPLVHEGIGTIEIDGAVRFSCGAFTTADEVDKAIAAVADVVSFGKEIQAAARTPVGAA